MLELLVRQPVAVRLGPAASAQPIHPVMDQAEAQDLLLRAGHVAGRKRAQPHQRAHRLVRCIRHPDRRELPGPQ